MLRVETIDVNGLARKFRDSAKPAEDAEILEIGQAGDDFDLRAAGAGNMTMAEILLDFDEPTSRSAASDQESPLTIPESDLNLGEPMHWSQGFVNMASNKHKFQRAAKTFQKKIGIEPGTLGQPVMWW